MNKHLEKYCVFAWAARLKPDLWYFRTSDLAARMRYWEKSALKKKNKRRSVFFLDHIYFLITIYVFLLQMWFFYPLRFLSYPLK